MRDLGQPKVLAFGFDEVMDIVEAVPDKVSGIDYFGTYVQRMHPDLIITATLNCQKSEQIYVILTPRT